MDLVCAKFCLACGGKSAYSRVWGFHTPGFMCVRSAGMTIVGVLLLAFTTRSNALTVEGFVKDRTGNLIKGADVHIQTKDSSKVVKTDANGYYRSDVFAAASYKVTVWVNGSVQASVVNAGTPVGRSAKLNFDLNTQPASGNKHKHMVWVPPETGTHIGGGRWVEVDDEKELPNNGKSARSLRKARPSETWGASPGAGLAAGRAVSPFTRTQ